MPVFVESFTNYIGQCKVVINGLNIPSCGTPGRNENTLTTTHCPVKSRCYPRPGSETPLSSPLTLQPFGTALFDYRTADLPIYKEKNLGSEPSYLLEQGKLFHR